MSESPDEYEQERKRHQPALYHRKCCFEEFINNNLNMTEPFTNAAQLLASPPIYEIYMSGSDQIWNFAREHTKYRLIPYLLWFTHSKNKIAYASGMNSDANTLSNIPFYYLPMLRAYKSIMVREESSVALLSRRIPCDDVKLVLDPSLLLSKDEYNALCVKPKQKNYIFAYLFDYDMEQYKHIVSLLSELACKLNKQVVLINNTTPVQNEWIHTDIGAGPKEWIGYVKNADIVMTNSFHGLAFAINFEIPFYVFGKDARKDTLLALTNLGDRYLDEKSAGIKKMSHYEFDFSQAIDLLEKERHNSRYLLKTALDSC